MSKVVWQAAAKGDGEVRLMTMVQRWRGRVKNLCYIHIITLELN